MYIPSTKVRRGAVACNNQARSSFCLSNQKTFELCARHGIGSFLTITLRNCTDYSGSLLSPDASALHLGQRFREPSMKHDGILSAEKEMRTCSPVPCL